jgi:hypothetical protein
MPFSATNEEHTEEYWTEHFEAFLKPLVEECKTLDAVRSEALRGDILRQIIADLINSAVVVADLTDRNPNVYWELGVRHSFKQCTVTIAEAGTKLPFDLSVKGTLFYYPKNYIKNEKFKRQFLKAIQDCLSHPETPDSPILETISGRGTLFQIIHRDEVNRRIEALFAEHRSNALALKEVCDQVGKPGFYTHRFRTAAVELLITNRYLDEDAKFYDAAASYFNFCFSLNEQLNSQRITPQVFDKWITHNRTNYDRVFAKYVEALNEARNRMVSVGQ